MTNEEKIDALIKRIEVLETAEKKRNTKKRLKLMYEIIKISIIIIIFLGSYLYINSKVIKPYNEVKETIIETINDKASSIESTLNNKLDKIKEWFKN